MYEYFSLFLTTLLVQIVKLNCRLLKTGGQIYWNLQHYKCYEIYNTINVMLVILIMRNEVSARGEQKECDHQRGNSGRMLADEVVFPYF